MYFDDVLCIVLLTLYDHLFLIEGSYMSNLCALPPRLACWLFVIEGTSADSEDLSDGGQATEQALQASNRRPEHSNAAHSKPSGMSLPLATLPPPPLLVHLSLDKQ